MTDSLLSAAERLLVWLSHAAWQAGLLALVVLALIWLARGRLQPRWRFALWMVVFARLAMPVLPAAPWSLFQFIAEQGTLLTEVANRERPAANVNEPQSPAPGVMVVPSSVATATPAELLDRGASPAAGAPLAPFPPDSAPPVEAAAESPPASHVPWLRFATVVWMAGIVVLLVRHAVTSLRFRWERFSWQLVADREQLATLEGCRRKARVRRAVRLVLASGDLGPATCGILRPCIVLPRRLAASLSPAELRLVLLHELVHVRRFDVLWDRLATLVTIIHWFHPVGWLARFLLRKDRELACDAAVLDRSGEHTAAPYGHVILKTVETLITPSPLPGLVGMFSRRPRSFLERRIRLIAGYRKGTWGGLAAGAGVLLGLVLVGLTDAQIKSPTPNHHEAGAMADEPSLRSQEAGGGADADAVLAATKERLLRFPADRSLGVVYTRPAREDTYDTGKWPADWKQLGEARGELRVPQDVEVQLVASSAAAQDLAPLKTLHADDLHSLSLRLTQVKDAQLEQVGRLTGLRHLDLTSAAITDAGIKHLAGLVNLRIITLDAIYVDTKGFGVGDEAVAVLAKLPRLTTLILRRTKVSDAGMVHVGRMNALKIVSLSGTRVTDAGLVPLKELPALESLDLGAREEGKNFTDNGARHVAQIATLKWLRMSAPQLTDAGLRHLSALTRLEWLEIEYSKVTSAGLAALKPLKSLKVLRVPFEVEDEGAKHLGELTSLEQIQSNFLSLSDTGVASLSRLKRLESLTIGGKRITDASLEHVSHMESLKHLMIQLAPLTDEGLAHLRHCGRLESLSISGTDITPDGLQHLAGMPSLRSLGLAFAKKGDLKPLEKLSGLTHLSLDSQGRGEVLSSDQLKSVSVLKDLDSLIIADPVVDDDGLAHLAGLKRLTRLQIRKSLITDAGMASIAKLQRLEHLQISGLIADRGLDDLAKLKSLKLLSISSPFVTDEGLNRLRISLSGLQFVNRHEYRNADGGYAMPNARDGIFRQGKPEDRALEDVLEGQGPPALRLDGWVNTDGKALRLEDLKGKVVLLDFWGVWCRPCIAAMPKIEELHREHSAAGLTVIGVHTTDRAADMADFVKTNELPWPMANDVEKATTTAYRVPAYPSYYLIDRSGKLRMAAVHTADLTKAVKLLLAEDGEGKPKP